MNENIECQRYGRNKDTTINVAKYKKMGYDDFEAQCNALIEYQQKGDIIFKEV